MELDTIKTQLRELQSYYTEETKSDDDIIYAVYNWVRSAHVVAQLLLLEGRFRELRRCLHLCRIVLEENNCGRSVIRSAVGEDRLLMNALLIRTLQLERQCEAAKRVVKGRDTEYYMRKLQRGANNNNNNNNSNNEEEDRDDGMLGNTMTSSTLTSETFRDKLMNINTNNNMNSKKRSVSPPERGVSLGRCTRFNRWKVPPVLPALVTQSQPFFQSASDNFLEKSQDRLRSKRSDGSLLLFSESESELSSRSSSFRGGEEEEEELQQQQQQIQERNKNEEENKDKQMTFQTIPTLITSTKEINTKDVKTPYINNYNQEKKKIEKLLGVNSLILPPLSTTIAAATKTADTKSKPQLRKSLLVRPLSAGLNTSILPTGEIEYRVANDADAHSIKAAIAVKSATNIRHRSTAVMQALNERASSLVQRKQSSCIRSNNNTNTLRYVMNNEKHNDDDNIINENIKREISSRGSMSSIFTLGEGHFSHNRVSKDESSPTFSPNKIKVNSTKSTTFLKTRESIDLITNKTEEKEEEENNNKKGFLGNTLTDLCERKTLLDPLDLSPSARNQLDNVYKNYQDKKEELKISMKMMHRKAKEQIDIFKPHETIVQLEDTAVWKAKRRNPAISSIRSFNTVTTASDHRILQSVDIVDSETISNNSVAEASAISTLSQVPVTVETIKTSSCGAMLDHRATLTVEHIAGLSLVDTQEWSLKEYVGELYQMPSNPTGVTMHNGYHHTLNEDNTNKNVISRKKNLESFSLSRSSAREIIPKPPAPTMAEKRLMLLRSSVHIVLPEVHEIVMERTEEKVRQERQSKSSEYPFLSQNYFSPANTTNEISKGLNNDINNSNTMNSDMPLITMVREALERLKEQQKQQQEEEEEEEVKKDNNNNNNNNNNEIESEKRRFSSLMEEPHPHMLITLKELQSHIDWSSINPATLSMCFPIHSAVVKLQRAFRCLAAKCERSHRTNALQKYLSQAAIREESAIVIQRYLRRLLARRQKLTLLLRSSYQIDQRVINELSYDESSADDANTDVFVVEAVGRKASDTLAYQGSSENSNRRPSEAPYSSTGSHINRRGKPPALMAVCTKRLYRLPMHNYCLHPSRYAGLRRIQKNIACRIIVRAFRKYLQIAMLRWEKDMKTIMKLVTGRITPKEAFDHRRVNISRKMSESYKELSLNERGKLSFSFEDQSIVTDVFPLSPARVTGDIIANWETRALEAQRRGDFIAPLISVKLSELQNILFLRQEAAELERRQAEEKQMEEEEEAQQMQRVRVDAVLILQRCLRGYQLRRWLFMYQQKVNEIYSLHHRRAELLEDASLGITHPHIAKIKGNRLVMNSSIGQPIYSETNPIPVYLNDIIVQGIRNRNQTWFGLDKKICEKREESVILVQSFLRWHNSLNYIADCFNNVNAMIIQRRWRLFIKKRDAIKKEKERNRMEFIRNIGF